jgi:hypothetical protein
MGSSDRIVPFPQTFKELLTIQANSMKKKQALPFCLSLHGRKSTLGCRPIVPPLITYPSDQPFVPVKVIPSTK